MYFYYLLFFNNSLIINLILFNFYHIIIQKFRYFFNFGTQNIGWKSRTIREKKHIISLYFLLNRAKKKKKNSGGKIEKKQGTGNTSISDT